MLNVTVNSQKSLILIKEYFLAYLSVLERIVGYLSPAHQLQIFSDLLLHHSELSSYRISPGTVSELLDVQLWVKACAATGHYLFSTSDENKA